MIAGLCVGIRISKAERGKEKREKPRVQMQARFVQLDWVSKLLPSGFPEAVEACCCSSQCLLLKKFVWIEGAFDSRWLTL